MDQVALLGFSRPRNQARRMPPRSSTWAKRAQQFRRACAWRPARCLQSRPVGVDSRCRLVEALQTPTVEVFQPLA